jgi:hypothetical protein
MASLSLSGSVRQLEEILRDTNPTPGADHSGPVAKPGEAAPPE